MAHPERKKFIPYLKEMLGDVPVVWDQKNNIWDTCRRAWLAQDPACEYGLVIQDDAVICKNFRRKAERILAVKRPQDYIYSFYAGHLLTSRIGKAIRDKEDFVISSMIVNEVALAMRTEHIEPMVKFCDERQSTTDQDITKWAHQKRLPIYYTVPSLVDHRDDESLYRKIFNKPQSDRPRRAALFIGNL
jgi:hypothetical protein